MGGGGRGERAKESSEFGRKETRRCGIVGKRLGPGVDIRSLSLYLPLSFSLGEDLTPTPPLPRFLALPGIILTSQLSPILATKACTLLFAFQMEITFGYAWKTERWANFPQSYNHSPLDKDSRFGATSGVC